MGDSIPIGNKPTFFQQLASLEENPKLKQTLKVMGVVVGVLATIAIVAGIGGALSLGGVHIFAVIHSPYNIAMISAGGAGLVSASVIIIVGFTVKYLNQQKAEKRQKHTTDISLENISEAKESEVIHFCVEGQKFVRQLYAEHGVQFILKDQVYPKLRYLSVAGNAVFVPSTPSNQSELTTLLEAKETDKFITDFGVFQRLVIAMSKGTSFEEVLQTHPEIADNIYFREPIED